MKEPAAIQAASAGHQTVESGSSAHVRPEMTSQSTTSTTSPTSAPTETSKSKAKAAAPAPGLTFPRFFTEADVDPFDEIEWDLRAAVIGNERGEVVFEQRDVEIPKSWSQQATNIVVSKYFRGQIGTPERERSVKQLIGRVVDTMTAWARNQKYFATEAD